MKPAADLLAMNTANTRGERGEHSFLLGKKVKMGLFVPNLPEVS